MVAPEVSMGETLMMTEASRIKELLVQEQIDAHAELATNEAKRLEDIRSRLGYSSVPTDNDADLIDTRVQKEVVITPEALTAILPVSTSSAETTRRGRASIANILTRSDDRLVVITGPCSIHDPEAALEYARHVKEWRDKHGDDLEIVMRAYMEKPRTELGWKGMIYDPKIDESNDINLGIVVSRLLSLQITNTGVPIAMERLNALTPQYFNGLVAYDAIGARNTTDQKAREYGSGTSSPVGFKNTPEGSVKAAVQAVVAANGPHSFLGMGMDGLPNQVNTTGNKLAHIILRGADSGPNYSSTHVGLAKRMLKKKHLLEAIVIDASHANSMNHDKEKEPNLQPEVTKDIARQVGLGQQAIKGVMLESSLMAGKQEPAPIDQLVRGMSITDACIGLDQTRDSLKHLAKAVRLRREKAAGFPR